MDNNKLIVEIEQSKHSDLAYRALVVGSVNGITVVGYTTTYFHGLDYAPTLPLVVQILILNRADGTGRDVPLGARAKVEREVLAGLLRIE